MEQQTQQLKRSIAHKIALSNVQNFSFVKGDGVATSNYLEQGALQIARACVMGTIIQKQGPMSMHIEDDTSQLQLRIFEDNGLFASVEIGDVVQAIGRPREYGNERYILPEIVKKISPEWLKVRKREISLLGHSSTPMRSTNEDANGSVETQQKNRSGESETATNELENAKIDLPAEKICAFIRDNDKGEGVDIDFVIGSRVVDDVEARVSSLLRNGDIFEIRPGRVKVLE
jgi:RPA family protein